MNYTNQQTETPQCPLAEWRQSLEDVDRAIDAGFWTLAALSEHASYAHTTDETRTIASDIAALFVRWENIAATIDEITTYERIDDLVSRLEALRVYVTLG